MNTFDKESIDSYKSLTIDFMISCVLRKTHTPPTSPLSFVPRDSSPESILKDLYDQIDT